MGAAVYHRLGLLGALEVAGKQDGKQRRYYHAWDDIYIKPEVENKGDEWGDKGDERGVLLTALRYAVLHSQSVRLLAAMEQYKGHHYDYREMNAEADESKGLISC